MGECHSPSVLCARIPRFQPDCAVSNDEPHPHVRDAFGLRTRNPVPVKPRSEEHTSELQSHSDLHSFPTRRSSDLGPGKIIDAAAWTRVRLFVRIVWVSAIVHQSCARGFPGFNLTAPFRMTNRIRTCATRLD